jgi:hypothetical protein
MSTICLFPIGWRSFHVSFATVSLLLKRLWSWLGADVYHMLVSYWIALFSCQSEFATEEVMELAGADVYHMLVSYWMALFSQQYDMSMTL